MGTVLQALGKHTLNVRSIENLAQDLAVRFKANIDYGIYNWFPFDEDGRECSISYENVVFGTAKFPGAEKTLWLFDESYMYHKVYEKYGKDAFTLPYFAQDKRHVNELSRAIGKVHYELRDHIESEDYCEIYTDTVLNYRVEFDPRWWTFCEAFTEEDNEDDAYSIIKCVNDYRTRLMEFFAIFGCSETFYFGDQGETECFCYGDYDWSAILQIMNTEYKGKSLNVADFMRNKQQMRQAEFPVLCYDDFSDLK